MNQSIARVCTIVWAAAVFAAYLKPDSTPLWVRIVIAAIVAAPVVAALAAWPILLVRGLPAVTVPTDAAGEDQETRVQVLPVPSSGRDGDV
jgi:hypothetical protein